MLTLEPPREITWDDNVLFGVHVEWFRAYVEIAAQTATGIHNHEEFIQELCMQALSVPNTHPVQWSRCKTPVDPSGSRLRLEFRVSLDHQTLNVQPDVVGPGPNPRMLKNLTQCVILELLKLYPELLDNLDPASGSFNFPLAAEA